MNGFATAAAGPLTTEPNKRVNYTLGLVLGVDEFQQDQLYHAAGRRWHNSLLHGYGTVSGLAVTTPAPGEAEPEIRVAAGVAVDPCGREICVPQTMCVRLSSWLSRHRPTLEPLFPGGDAELPLAIVLCYRECPDDVVPIPGEPCRTQEDAMQPSRLRDSFELRLALREDAFITSLPEENESGLQLYRRDDAEETGVRAFGDVLSRVQLVSVDASETALEELLDAVRAIGTEGGESLPGGDILIAQSGAADAYREAFRVWAVEVRPRLRDTSGDALHCGPSSDECCVLLAEINLPVTPTWTVAGTEFEPIEENRPILLHTRVLQEWLASGSGSSGNDDTFATVEPVATDTVRLWLHYPDPLEVEVADIEAVVNGAGAAAPAVVNAVAGSTNSFDVQLAAPPPNGAEVELRINLASIMVSGPEGGSLAAALHSTQGGFLDRYGTVVRAYTVFRQLTPLLPPFTGDVSGTHPATTVVGLHGRGIDAAPAPVDGNTLIFNGTTWRPGTPPPPPMAPATGDVTGTYPALTVAGLRGRAISANAPQLNQYLRWNGSQWTPSHAGGFVYAPAGRYEIVGAGHFDLRGAAIGPVYNGLSVTMTVIQDPLTSERTFVYRLTFPGYETVTGTSRHTYIVHAWFHPRTDTAAFGLNFSRFFAGGIEMRMFVAPRVNVDGRLIIEIYRIG